MIMDYVFIRLLFLYACVSSKVGPPTLVRFNWNPPEYLHMANETNALEGKRVLSIQSHVVHGYVGNNAAVFPLQVCVQPSAVSRRYILCISHVAVSLP